MSLCCADEKHLSSANIMATIIQHYVVTYPTAKKYTVLIMGIPPSTSFIEAIKAPGVNYIEFNDGLIDDISVLKILIISNSYIEDHDINVVKLSHYVAPLAGSEREYRYHIDSNEDIDRFVFISDKLTGIH